jgi:hydrogenase maturation protein HypF
MKVRTRFFFEGMVQGVGFRPFLWRQANIRGLAGFVRNRPDGVVAEVEGEAAVVEAFLAGVEERLPPLAEITRITRTELPLAGGEEGRFMIVASDSEGPGDVQISPDIATCDACLAELSDPGNRRFRYPFINCTDCGPRLTIINTIPYDRANTSMACFPLCPECRREYEDPADRRFHAEPNACPVCGPRLELLDAAGRPLPGGDPVGRTLDLLREGAVLAIKGLGGFHLAVDGQNEDAVRRLRVRKCREEKPLAVMVRDLETARKLAVIDETERALLTAPERPVVLLQRRREAPVAPSVAPGMATLGIMLPYTPLQHLLLAGDLPILVMTSANRTDEPICIGNREAIRRLKGIADAFLIHNRDVLVRCDDSVVMASGRDVFPLRRSRGYAPRPIALRKSYPEVLALGPQIKSTLCVLKKGYAYLSPHIGDLETPEARDFFHESIALMERITECRPRLIACDLHPGYYASQEARRMVGREAIAVQHHHAHIVSVLAENRLAGEVIGLAMDGTGFGADGQVWGGEFLRADERSFARRGHLKYLLLPGGERAVREPWRMAASLLRDAFGEDWPDWAQRLRLVPSDKTVPVVREGEVAEREIGRGEAGRRMATDDVLAGLELVMAGRIRCPRTSSLGRIFDGVAALCGLRREVGFEGQAAMELEALARGETDLRLPYTIREEGPEDPHYRASGERVRILDLTPAVRAMAEDLVAGRPRREIALAFHRLLPEALTAMAEILRGESGLNRAALSGGCFQNRLLMTGCREALSAAGFETFTHRIVPPNDGCISLGQAVSAGARAVKGR